MNVFYWIIYSHVIFGIIYVFSDNPNIPSGLVDNPIVYLANLFFISTEEGH